MHYINPPPFSSPSFFYCVYLLHPPNLLKFIAWAKVPLKFLQVTQSPWKRNVSVSKNPREEVERLFLFLRAKFVIEKKWLCATSRWAHDVEMTSYWHRCIIRPLSAFFRHVAASLLKLWNPSCLILLLPSLIGRRKIRHLSYYSIKQKAVVSHRLCRNVACLLLCHWGFNLWIFVCSSISVVVSISVVLYAYPKFSMCRNTLFRSSLRLWIMLYP